MLRCLTRMELPVLGSWLPNPRTGATTTMNCLKNNGSQTSETTGDSPQNHFDFVLFNSLPDELYMYEKELLRPTGE